MQEIFWKLGKPTRMRCRLATPFSPRTSDGTSSPFSFFLEVWGYHTYCMHTTRWSNRWLSFLTVLCPLSRCKRERILVCIPIHDAGNPHWIRSLAGREESFFRDLGHLSICRWVMSTWSVIITSPFFQPSTHIRASNWVDTLKHFLSATEIVSMQMKAWFNCPV